MANITAQMVKELRESTGAGMMDCKAALTESNGEMQAAQDWLSVDETTAMLRVRRLMLEDNAEAGVELLR